MGFFDFLTGTPAKYEQVSNLTPSQLKNQNMLQQAGAKRGAGGAFGTSADFYRDILDNNPQSLQELYAPELRQFREQTIPDLAEQFAGMGAGNLSSSGFRNAAVNAGTDLSERLANMRQQLRFNAAQGLSGIGAQGLVPHAQYQQTEAATEGFLPSFAKGFGASIPGFGDLGGFFGGGGSSQPTQPQNFGGTSPYGNQNMSGYQGSFGQLPQFGQR